MTQSQIAPHMPPELTLQYPGGAKQPPPPPDRIPLVIDSENSNVPILLDAPGVGKVVQGQVYAIDQTGIEILDLFEENHEIGAYRRVKVDIVLDNKFLRSHEDQDKIDCQCYVFNGLESEIERLKKLPFLDTYQSNGDHGLAYRLTSVDLEFGSTLIQNQIGEEFFHERRDFTDDTSDKQTSASD